MIVRFAISQKMNEIDKLKNHFKFPQILYLCQAIGSSTFHLLFFGPDFTEFSSLHDAISKKENYIHIRNERFRSVETHSMY